MDVDDPNNNNNNKKKTNNVIVLDARGHMTMMTMMTVMKHWLYVLVVPVSRQAVCIWPWNNAVQTINPSRLSCMMEVGKNGNNNPMYPKWFLLPFLRVHQRKRKRRNKHMAVNKQLPLTLLWWVRMPSVWLHSLRIYQLWRGWCMHPFSWSRSFLRPNSISNKEERIMHCKFLLPELGIAWVKKESMGRAPSLKAEIQFWSYIRACMQMAVGMKFSSNPTESDEWTRIPVQKRWARS